MTGNCADTLDDCGFYPLCLPIPILPILFGWRFDIIHKEIVSLMAYYFRWISDLASYVVCLLYRLVNPRKITARTVFCELGIAANCAKNWGQAVSPDVPWYSHSLFLLSRFFFRTLKIFFRAIYYLALQSIYSDICLNSEKQAMRFSEIKRNDFSFRCVPDTLTSRFQCQELFSEPWFFYSALFVSHEIS